MRRNEIDADAARYARKELGLSNVCAVSFADLDYPDGFLDMSMVLEYFHESGAALRRITRLLRADGPLVAVPTALGKTSRMSILARRERAL